MEESYKQHLYALIICGGAGTRLWPRSRQKTPKQFLENFYGEKTLFQQTMDRAKLLTDITKIFIVTLADFADEILQQSPDILVKNIITEPFGKNTAMAVGIGASYIKKIDPKAVIMNFWSDAAIKDEDLFLKSLNLAAKTAFENNYLVAVGLKPTFPHTGLGYIETNGKIDESENEIYKVSSFKEKPDFKTAETFLEKGNYFWNTGIYVWSVETIFEAFSKYSPEIFKFLKKINEDIGTNKERETVLDAYNNIESLPIDTAVSEKADNLLLVPASFGWSDIGDWKAAFDLKEKDQNGNVIQIFGPSGWYLSEGTKNCLIASEDKLVVAIGVEDLIIVQTKDAILVCQKEKTQDVKKIVNTLKDLERKDLL
jgi:mannose-1-phosphate guanylyltransferase